MTARTSALKIGAVAVLSGLAPLVYATASSATSPAVDAFDVSFVDSSCGEGLDAATTLHVQFTDKLMPDGSLHHWLDLSGTLTNEANGRVVTVHAARRFTDSSTSGSSIFRGLQGQFSAAGGGVLVHTSGWSDDVVVHGRWDHTPTDELPPEVCAYLFG
jgi:hypothetical protein